MFVKPAPGLSIVDPDLNDFLPVEGREVPDTDYWHRMKLADDVIEVAPPAAPVIPQPQFSRATPPSTAD